MQAQDILDFWFGAKGSAAHGTQRPEWFSKDNAFDAQIRERFNGVIERAVNGGLRDWDDEGPQGRLARVIVLDQFTRNAWRDTPGAFQGDVLALGAAQQMVSSGQDQQLSPVERVFAYLPFEHAEDAAMQEKSVALFTALSRADAGFDLALDYALRHRGVIARFGRFPHRNAILGRSSSAEELAYLSQPGAGF